MPSNPAAVLSVIAIVATTLFVQAFCQNCFQPSYSHYYAVQDHVVIRKAYRNVTTDMLKTCTSACLKDVACKSFNFCRDKQSCQLNVAMFTKEEGDLIPASGCVYFGPRKECSSVLISGDYEYNFIYPPLESGNSFRLDFAVKGERDATLSLSQYPNEDNYYETVIGGWENGKSAIRCKTDCRPQYTIVDTPGIMSATEYRRFWITYDNATIRVGRGGEADPFMEWYDPTHRVPIKYIGIAAYENYLVSWIFYTFCDSN